jgi:hypothetical protein
VLKLIDFIVKYWVEVLFGLICGAVAFVVRHHVKLIIADKKRHETDMLKAIDEKFDQQNENMKEQMKECYSNLIEVVRESEARSEEEDRRIHHEIDIIKDGMLSVEGRAFRNECRRLLEEGHIITFNEYEAILAEHITYNNLGGNHEGDGLFSMVQAKYQNQLHIEKEGE